MVQQEPLREAVLPQSLVKYTQSTLCFRLLTVSSSSLSGVPNPIREAPSLRLLCQTRSLWGGSNYPLCNMFACTSSSLFHREQTLVRMIEASDVLVCLPFSVSGSRHLSFQASLDPGPVHIASVAVINNCLCPVIRVLQCPDQQRYQWNQGHVVKEKVLNLK